MQILLVLVDTERFVTANPSDNGRFAILTHLP